MEDADTTVVSFRDDCGRFQKGNPGGPGPTGLNLRIKKFRSALLDTVTCEDIADISRKLVDQARGGDVFAARLVLAYCLGDPADIAKASALEEQEVALKEAVKHYVVAIPMAPPAASQEEAIRAWVERGDPSENQ